MGRSLIEIIGGIEDPRRGNAIRYNLAEVCAGSVLSIKLVGIQPGKA